MGSKLHSKNDYKIIRFLYPTCGFAKLCSLTHTLCMTTPVDGCIIIIPLLPICILLLLLVHDDDDDTGAVINNFRFTILDSSCRMNSVAIGFITRSFKELIRLLSSGPAIVGDYR